MFQLFNKYYSPDDSGGISDSGDAKSEDTFELLNTEEPAETLDLDESESDETDEKVEESDELKEIEDELKDEEEPKEEDLLELTTPVRRKEILAKYPKLFKDFPYLEKAYYREQQFTEILPTVNDAKIAVEKARILDDTEQQILSGDIGQILSAVKNNNQESFNRIADNYLNTIRSVDQGAYYHILGNVIKDTIITMVKESRALGEQGTPLQAAANILNQFVFGSQNFTPPTSLSKRVSNDEQVRQSEYQRQNQEIFNERFTSVKDDLQSKADNVLKSTIDGHIDPNGSMTNYVKSHATKEAFDNLEDLISKDARFRSLLDKLWQKAFETNFDKDSTNKIKSAYLSKAKTLLPSVIKKARNDALKGMSRNNESIEERPIKKGPITPGKSTSPNSSGKYRKASDIPRGMTTLDVLMKD